MVILSRLIYLYEIQQGEESPHSTFHQKKAGEKSPQVYPNHPALEFFPAFRPDLVDRFLYLAFLGAGDFPIAPKRGRR